MPLCLQWARRRETRYHEAAERREQTTSGMAFQPTRVAAGPFTEHTTYIQKDVFDKLHTKFTTAPACANQRRSVTSPWHGPCDLRLSHRRHALLVPFALSGFPLQLCTQERSASRLPPPEHLCFQLFLPATLSLPKAPSTVHRLPQQPPILLAAVRHPPLARVC